MLMVRCMPIIFFFFYLIANVKHSQYLIWLNWLIPLIQIWYNPWNLYFHTMQMTCFVSCRKQIFCQVDFRLHNIEDECRLPKSVDERTKSQHEHRHYPKTEDEHRLPIVWIRLQTALFQRRTKSQYDCRLPRSEY